MSEDQESSTAPEKPDKKTLREFSKSVNPNTRANKTPEIIQEKSFRKGAINSLGEQIKWEEDHLRLWQPKAENIEAEVQKTDADIARIKTNLVLKIFQRGKLAKLERRKQETESSEDYKSVEYYHHTLENLDQLRQALDIEKQHNKAKELLRAFYQDQEADWQRYQEDLRESAVENIIGKHGVVFVHGIRDTDHLPHSFVKTPLRWEDKLFINLAIGPTLSTSTIKEGRTIKSMFARSGVILSGGQVTTAYAYDMGSISTDFFSKGNRPEEHGHMAREIKNALDESDKKSKEDQNEFVIRNPQICGLYFCLDGVESERFKGSSGDIDCPEISRIQAVVDEIKIPLYAIKNGVVYEAVIENGEMKVLNPVKPEELIQRRYELPEEIKKEQLSRLMENCPFNLNIPDVWLVQSMAQGKMTYVATHSPREIDPSLIGDQKAFSFPGAFETIIFSYDEKGKLICTKRGATDQQTTAYNFESDFWDIENGYIYFGYTNEHSDTPITSDGTYLQAMGPIISGNKERLKGVSPQSYKVKEKYIERIAFHLYGYGELAGINGEEDVKQKTFELASQILPYEEYLQTVKQRVGSNGEFKMIPEDINN